MFSVVTKQGLYFKLKCDKFYGSSKKDLLVIVENTRQF